MKTTDADAYHYDGTLEYDAHIVYGLAETVATFAALRDLRPTTRPFILSRSTFIGNGRYGGAPFPLPPRSPGDRVSPGRHRCGRT